MVTTLLSPGAVHPETQVVLLLCGNFTSGAGSEAKPLSLTEYNALAQWLNRQDRRPADLLQAADEPFRAGEPGLPSVERVCALLKRGMQMAAALERWERFGLWVISRGEERYPARLRQVLRSAAPALLYGVGDVTRLNRGGLAVVGSRDIDEEGLSFTRRVAERCAAQHVPVISGGAKGVDQAAIAAALEAGGEAVAVLADRLDRTATSRDAKEALRGGLLTLITPYEPDAGFTVGRAMGRNKIVYALADHALVVRFKTGEGGTWAGADEQLRRNKSGSARITVFVRLAGNPEDGWRQLHERGARPFPEEVFWEGDINEALGGTAAPVPDLPQAAPDVPTIPPPQAPAKEEGTPPVSHQPAEPLTVTPADTTADGCYNLCLPLLLRGLREEEPGERQLAAFAKQRDLEPAQLKKWLKRAISEGRVKIIEKKVKGKKKRVYADASVGVDSSLFDRGDDAA